ncbi:MAG: hypothetical protein ABSB23_00590 [Bryobacteraceae bacterium]|jgi:hypothetical protein
MNVYPQLVTGVVSQFPIVKHRRPRTVVNAAADGSSIKLADPTGATVGWQIQYANLSDIELAALQQFFTAMEGSLNSFTFLDPAANLLAWSEDLTNAVWAAAPFLTQTSDVADPLGGSNGWQLTNSGGGAQALTQTLNAPTNYTYCFSVYAFSSQPATIELQFASNSAQAALTPRWSRIQITGTGDPTASSIEFGIELPAGTTVSVFGPQVEAQPAPSSYKTGTTGGVYANARFRDDAFTFTSTDVNHHSATVNIFYANSL